ncbi:MAG: helix-turn-helix domain-containing protein [Opitutaceae bacterium]|nr:helix-turn-helix domain-containing protein [Opitutaceae bacterium]
MSLAQRIAAARKKLGISQSEAAQKWGLSVRTLQNWEIGHRQPRGFARAQLEILLAEILDYDGRSSKRRL